MSRNTAAGNNAYRETRRSGGSKEESKQASTNASEKYHQQTRDRQFGNGSSKDNDVSDFNNSINDGAWHTSENL